MYIHYDSVLLCAYSYSNNVFNSVIMESMWYAWRVSMLYGDYGYGYHDLYDNQTDGDVVNILNSCKSSIVMQNSISTVNSTSFIYIYTQPHNMYSPSTSTASLNN